MAEKYHDSEIMRAIREREDELSLLKKTFKARLAKKVAAKQLAILELQERRHVELYGEYALKSTIASYARRKRLCRAVADADVRVTDDVKRPTNRPIRLKDITRSEVMISRTLKVSMDDARKMLEHNTDNVEFARDPFMM